MQQLIADFQSNFQFIRPLWLIPIPLFALWFRIRQRRKQTAGWGAAIQRKNLDHLQVSQSAGNSNWIPFAAMCLACVALAGPGTRTLPAKTGNSTHARVFILDLSPSMLARDVKPDRLTIAKLKLIDMLRLQTGNESALVVFAGSSHRVTPLTRDPQIVIELVPVLKPDIIPLSGSRAEDAIDMAVQLTLDAGYTHGDIVLITDGLHDTAITNIEKNWRPSFRLSVLAVGTEQGAPVPLPQKNAGAAVTHIVDANNRTVIARVNTGRLKQLANNTGGHFSVVTADSQDTGKIAALPPLDDQVHENNESKSYDQTHDAGYWLLLLLIPVTLTAFRKNVIWLLPPLLFIAPESHALDWIDLWLTKDQQAQQAMKKQDYKEASELFTDSRWRFSSLYRQGQYAASLDALKDPEYADDLYNRGNAQALAGDLSNAVVSYRMAALLYTTDAEKADALYNLSLLRRILNNEEQRDDSQSRGSGAADGDNPGSENTEADSDDASTGAQQQTGGVTGGDSTLQQAAIREQSSGGETRNTPDESVADDAQKVEDKTGTVDLLPEAAPLSTDVVSAPENDNPVLSPYSEQWLRELPVKPGGYLRRKFSYQLQLRRANNKADGNSQAISDSNPVEEVRY